MTDLKVLVVEDEPVMRERLAANECEERRIVRIRCL